MHCWAFNGGAMRRLAGLAALGEQTTMDIAGHVSRQMQSRYSHIGMEAKVPPE
jgi:hypothetical protein